MQPVYNTRMIPQNHVCHFSLDLETGGDDSWKLMIYRYDSESAMENIELILTSSIEVYYDDLYLREKGSIDEQQV